ncbi:MAG: Pyruvate formate-lyase 1-activating enzyme [Chloroflexi bacterium ADurb.Bin344]|nr:MAG: Pyruvate formate-lyase 1-activating enzyme [Chloroflexi bacterium ADurb.Bin344]
MMKICNKRKEPKQVLNIHELLPDSSVNGPGKRYVIWTQGCLKKCPECCNPATHDVGKRKLISIADLLDDIKAHSDDIEGISISGGEPFLQAGPLSIFLKNLRKEFPALSVVLFSGYTLAEIKHIPHGRKCLRYIDALVDGEYCASQATSGIPASENQKLYFFSTKYSACDFDTVPETEVFITASGELYVSGKPLSILMPKENK